MATPELINAVNRAIESYEVEIGEYASRTRQMIERHGYQEALSRIVQTPDLQSGFQVLRDRGKLELTFEAVIVNFAPEFPSAVVEAARWR